MGFRNPVTTAVDQTARDAAAAAATAIIPGSRLAADAIDGKTITGATLQTAASGPRVVIDSANYDSVKLYDGLMPLPAALQVVQQPGSGGVTSLDRGILTVYPPGISGLARTRMYLKVTGPTRDGTDLGLWNFKGAGSFDSLQCQAAPVGLSDVVRLMDLPVVGTVTVTPSAANTVTSVAVSFPAGKTFSAPPSSVVVTPITTGPNIVTCSAGAFTTTGFTLYMTRTNTTATSFSWAAFV